jgi:hypothetical protein
MEPVFSTFAASRSYGAFEEQITLVGLYLRKETLIHFLTLSKYFNNLLNNPESDFGRIFWKTFAVNNGGIKAYKSKRINFKFKLMMKVFDEIKKNAKVRKVPMWRHHSTCQNCGNFCHPDIFNMHFFDDRFNRYCNCEFVDCASKIEIIESDIELDMDLIIDKKRALHLQLLRLDERMEILVEKKKKVKTVRHLGKMKPAFKNMKQNGHYKETRKQATRALKELEEYDSWFCRVRRNVNYGCGAIGVYR